MSKAGHNLAISRFPSAAIDTSQAVSLRADHAAVTEGRTLFPTTVVGSLASPRLLVSGHNNPKLGKEVLKGDRHGWPIFHLTLEERATCPRTCAQWLACYGNAMPQARRHAVDADFLELLLAEVATVARQYPKGLLIRLHTLGDFYSVPYVLAWATLLARFPQVHVFGYTARRVDDEDKESAKIARAIKLLTDAMWDRFAIRTSHPEPGPERSIVVDAPLERANVIMCPAQVDKTAACATCGLCWTSRTRDKTIAFLRHGMTRARGSRGKIEAPAPIEEMRAKIIRRPPPIPASPPKLLPAPDYSAYQTASMSRIMAALEILAEDGKISLSLTALGESASIPSGSVSFLVDALERRGLITITRHERVGGKKPPNTYTLVPSPAPQLKTAAQPDPNIEPIAQPKPVATLPKTDAKYAPNYSDPIPPAGRPPARAPEPPKMPTPRAAVEADFVVDPDTPPPAGACSLLNLRRDRCHWPVGSGRPQMYCNAASEVGEEYCAGHLAAKFMAVRRAPKPLDPREADRRAEAARDRRH